MPNSFQPVTACAYNQRCFLTTFGTVMQCSQIIRHNLKGIKQIIKVLNLCNRSQSTHCHSNSLTEISSFPYTCITYSYRAKSFLHALHALVYSTYFTHVFTKGEHFGVFCEKSSKIVAQNK